MALTREDLQSLLQWLDEDPQFRAELRRRLLAEPLIVEIRLPTDWMTRVDERLERLESDVGTLKSDVDDLGHSERCRDFEARHGHSERQGVGS
jgi:hypothetical protein